MKKAIFFFFFIAFSFYLSAQERYTVNGENLDLKTEVEGDLDLLWNIMDKHFRYFVRTKGGNIVELVNTRDSSNNFQEEYKKVLHDLMQNSNVSTLSLKLTLSDLKTIFKTYNTSVSDTTYIDDKAYVKTRLAIYGGLTNHPYIENPNNKTVLFFGSEFEVYSQTKMPRHSGFFSISHALENSDIQFTTTQLALGYRYRFVNKSNFNIYSNLKFATYNFSKTVIEIADDAPNQTISGSSFDAPFIIGIGADIKISDNSYITIVYDSLFAAFLDIEANFPIDIALGYKFNL